MPKPVKMPKNKEFHFVTSPSGQAKYDWDGWFNGDLIMIERSEMVATGKDEEGNDTFRVTVVRDYDVLTDAMPPKIKIAARRRYKVCQISRIDPDGKRLNDALIIRARDMTEEERAEEDAERVVDKQKLKAAQAKRKAEANGEVTQDEIDAAELADAEANAA